MKDTLITIAREAGAEILKIYHDTDFSKVVDFKADDSPLTLADTASHKVIAARLAKHFPDIPILSEEGQQKEYAVRSQWKRFWLVDPLDGTKEFIKRNGDFTVNIALIEENRPVLGVIFAPTHDTVYAAFPETGAFKQVGEQPSQALHVNQKTENCVAVVSRSHASPEDQHVLSNYDVKETVSVGSSLKFCLVAEGTADLYFRSGPTMEWDTAAGQAILEHAGGSMSRIDGTPFRYNKESLLNPGFICKGWAEQ